MESETVEPEAKTTKNKPNQVKSYFKNFCGRTSLHGFQYVGDHELPALERVCWAIAICLGVSTCTYLINNVYQKWVTTPVIVSFAKTSTRVADIPFPAVTLCSGNKVRRPVFDFVKVYNATERTEEEKRKLEYASLLCKLGDYEDMETIVDNRAVEFLEEVGTPLDEMLMFCVWRNREIDCSEIFTSVLTDAGLCHTFNMVKADELFTHNVDPNQFVSHLNYEMNSSWTMEGGYESMGPNLYPFRSFASGSHEGLVFYYFQNTSEFCDSCGFPGFGFKILVHSPVDFPQVNTQYFRVPSEHDVVVGIRANMITTSSGLQRNLKPAARKCFMSYERNLHFFDIYSEANCDFECFVNASLKVCNCSSFFMPICNTPAPTTTAPNCNTRENCRLCQGAPNTPICGAGSHDCLDEVFESLHLEEESAKCDCLPSCTEIRYNIEVSESKVRWSKSLIYKPDKGIEIGRMQFYFKRNRFITRRRSELYGVADFIANCGGLLGLFLGFSFLSLVEVFYFLLMRPLVVLTNLWCRRHYCISEPGPEPHRPKLQGKEP